jgi:hypothetical protein
MDIALPVTPAPSFIPALPKETMSGQIQARAVVYRVQMAWSRWLPSDVPKLMSKYSGIAALGI